MDRCKEPIITWSVHPASKQPVKALIAIFFIGLFIGGVYQSTGELIYCAIALIVLLITLSPFFQKTTYTIDPDGISKQTMGFRKYLPWPSVRGYTVSPRGVYVSPLKRSVWWDNKGIFLLFNNEGEMVLARIEEKMGKN